MNERDKEFAEQAGFIHGRWLKAILIPVDCIQQVQKLIELIRADEREVWAKDADWCIQNHLEHLIPERIRARSAT